jgi:hypothetical protein
MGPMSDNDILAPVPHLVSPAKARMIKLIKHATSQGHDDVHHLDDTAKYLQVCIFSNFIKKLLNCVRNNFLQ